MKTKHIACALAPALVAAGAVHAETLYERDGIILEGSVRMVHRNAATCQILAENESPDAYEQIKANHGQPLHVWRLDYSALNGSGKSLSDLTAHFQIEAEWPPCTNWTGLGQYPGPVQWAGSFETIQRSSGMAPGEEAAATTYVLAFAGQQPRFGRRQVTYRFGLAGPQPETAVPVPMTPSAPAVQLERGPRPLPSPLCKDDPQPYCWVELENQPGCHVFLGVYDEDLSVTWSAECTGGNASGMGMLVLRLDEDSREDSGQLVDGKPTGHWTIRHPNGRVGTGPFLDGRQHGRWTMHGENGAISTGEIVHGERHGEWLRLNPDGTSITRRYVRGEIQPLEEVP